MADKDRPIEPEGIDHVECMQGDGEHVAQTVSTLGIAVARQQWREHPPAARERREKRAVFGQSAGAVEKNQRSATARLEHADFVPATSNLEKVGANGHVAASATEDPGTTRLGSGWIQKRSSPS